jgi:HD superfamily phosphohydrolase
MSTAGKVLTVLILLVMAVWLVMMSAVTQLNVNHAQKVQKQQADLEKVTADAEKATKDFLSLTENARLVQDLTDRELRVRLGRISAGERRQSSTTEDLTRLKFQLADYLAAVEKAQKNLATREAEKAKGEDDLAKKKDEIAKAQAENAELRTQLAQLQDEFKKLLAENAEAVSKAATKTPAAKPASSRRESPSS